MVYRGGSATRWAGEDLRRNPREDHGKEEGLRARSRRPPCPRPAAEEGPCRAAPLPAPAEEEVRLGPASCCCAPPRGGPPHPSRAMPERRRGGRGAEERRSRARSLWIHGGEGFHARAP
ncbi:unnamed protein product [Urochloa humidicola]